MLSKKSTITCLLVLSMALLASTNAHGQTLASARILSSDGAVEIQRPSQSKGLLTKIDYSVNDELFAGDVIRTLKGGRLVLGLTDGSQAIIGEQTILQIMDTSASPRTIFNVLRGKTRVKIEKVGGRPNPYRVNTPTTVIAVRGTLFDVIVEGGETDVFVHEGEVAVSNIARPDATVTILPGQRTRVFHTQPPETPTRFQPGRNDGTFRQSQKDKGGKSTGQVTESERKQQRGQQQQAPDNPSPRAPQDGQRQDAPPPGKPNSKREGESKRRAAQFFSDNG
jgi:hypothetical protein